jgi:hypothetical protein
MEGLQIGLWTEPASLESGHGVENLLFDMVLLLTSLQNLLVQNSKHQLSHGQREVHVEEGQWIRKE